MSVILLAGASGSVGRAILNALQETEYSVRGLIRNPAKLDSSNRRINGLFVADARVPQQLKDSCIGVDIVISALGGSLQLRWTDSKSTYWDIDFEANRNLLQEAKRSGVNKFIYISVFSQGLNSGKAYFAAHAAFEQELINSGLNYSIIRPTGLFYIFEEFINFARKGIVPLIGDGSARTNPVDENDIANICLSSLESPSEIIDVGGPEIYSRREVGELCFRTLEKNPGLSSTPKA